MDNFETPYEDEAEFIQCTVCDKSIKGETLYKLHLTTPGHLKKEEELVSSGLRVRQQTLPAFKDILHYLDYMKLDEPIIGLAFLEEVPCHDPIGGPKYTCKLCNQTSNLPEMVRHVIGRKHRQKYVELRRPDLVTWDKQSILAQGGKIIKARAEIIERQDGRGTPIPMMRNKNVGHFNISRGPSRQNQNTGRNMWQASTQEEVSSNLPPVMGFDGEHSHQGRFPRGGSNTPHNRPEETYMTRRGQGMYQQGGQLSHNRLGEELQRGEYRERDMHRREYGDPDYQRDFEGEFSGDTNRRGPLESHGGPVYNSREEMLHGEAWHEDYYPGQAPSPKTPYPERDLTNEFYSEVRHLPNVSRSQENDYHVWPMDGDSDRHISGNRPGRQGPDEAEVNNRVFSSHMDAEKSRDNVFKTIREYPDDMRIPHQEEDISQAGSSRTGPPKSQRVVMISRSMPDIPEPFRRFLKGSSNEDVQNGKRKRKSRFSDATAEEVETVHEMFSDQCGPPNPKFGGRPQQDIYGRHDPDPYMQSECSQDTERNQRETSDSGGLFDMLQNIKIENADDEKFLKSKLCDLLKEFKNKKSAVQNSQGRTFMTQDYDNFKQDPTPASRHQHEPATKQDTDHRRPEDLYFKRDHRRTRWDREERISNERFPEYSHPPGGDYPTREEPRQPNRSHYEEVFGLREKSWTPHNQHSDEPDCYTERFQKPIPSRDYRPTATDDVMGTPSHAPPLRYDREPSMNRGPRYSNLDKITSTLLELVARKQSS